MIEIDFDSILNDAVNSAIDATVHLLDQHPECEALAHNAEFVGTIAAHTAVSVLKQYHQQLCASLSSPLSGD